MDNLSAFGDAELGEGEGEGWNPGRDLPVGNAICFIRLFYKPDIRFVQEDLVTDYSVNSQIITITGERGKDQQGRWAWGGGERGCQQLFQGQHPPSAPSKGDLEVKD